MKLGIIIRCFNRSDYLYITLSQLFQCNGIKKSRVHLFFDGGLTEQERINIHSVISHFPIYKICFATQKMWQLENMIFIMDMMFKEDYDAVLFMPCDLLISKRAIRWLYETEKNAFFYCLYLNHIDEPIHYSTYPSLLGYMINKESWDFMSLLMKSKSYLGISHNTELPIYKVRHLELPLYKFQDDLIIAQLAEKYSLLAKFPPENMSFHFGMESSFKGQYGDSELKDILFCGNRKRWLNNLYKIMQKRPEYLLKYNVFGDFNDGFIEA